MSMVDFKRARGKTAVFSGTRHVNEYVPRLEDMCIQKLIDNINKIEYIGDVPYFILKPILIKCSVSQLKQIESFNPAIVEDSDELWELHCKRHFSDKKRNKNETWRDLYHRCEEERDHKLQKITRRIKRHERKAVPVRQAQVVDQIMPQARRRAAGNPVISMMARNVSTPSRSTSSQSSGSGGSSTQSAAVAAIKRQTISAAMASSQANKKPKVAPLMQKSMLLFKSRFKR